MFFLLIKYILILNFFVNFTDFFPYYRMKQFIKIPYKPRIFVCSFTIRILPHFLTIMLSLTFSCFVLLLQALKWDLTPMTTNAWLSVYLQVANIDHIHDPALGFVFPQFSTHAFIQISRVTFFHPIV